jgi:hypothetical protein
MSVHKVLAAFSLQQAVEEEKLRTVSQFEVRMRLGERSEERFVLERMPVAFVSHRVASLVSLCLCSPAQQRACYDVVRRIAREARAAKQAELAAYTNMDSVFDACESYSGVFRGEGGRRGSVAAGGGALFRCGVCTTVVVEAVVLPR